MDKCVCPADNKNSMQVFEKYIATSCGDKHPVGFAFKTIRCHTRFVNATNLMMYMYIVVTICITV